MNLTIGKSIHVEIGLQSSIWGTEGRVYLARVSYKWPWDQALGLAENGSSNQ